MLLAENQRRKAGRDVQKKEKSSKRGRESRDQRGKSTEDTDQLKEGQQLDRFSRKSLYLQEEERRGARKRGKAGEEEEIGKGTRHLREEGKRPTGTAFPLPNMKAISAGGGGRKRRGRTSGYQQNTLLREQAVCTRKRSRIRGTHSRKNKGNGEKVGSKKQTMDREKKKTGLLYTLKPLSRKSSQI